MVFNVVHDVLGQGCSTMRCTCHALPHTRMSSIVSYKETV